MPCACWDPGASEVGGVQLRSVARRLRSVASPRHRPVGASRPRPGVRWLRAGVLAAAAGMFLAVLPLPVVGFELRSAGAVEEVTELRPVSPAELDEIAAETGVRPPASQVAGGDDSVETFTTIGFRLDEVPAGPVFVRVAAADGSVGEWTEVAVSDEGPDGGTAEAAQARVTTDPVYVGAAVGYEVSLPGGVEAEAVTVHDRLQRVSVEATAFAATAPPPFPVKRRSEWGARQVTGVATASKLTLGVIHHTAGTNNYTAAQVPGILRGIQAFHIDGRGWTDAGYNFAVDKFGTVWEMRATSMDANAVGAHAIGFNTGSVGVAILGDYISSQAPSVAIEGAAKVFGWKLARNGVDPEGRTNFTAGSGSDKFARGTVANLPTVTGHRETSSTTCPGRISEQLGVMRDRAGFWADQSVGGASPVGSVDSASLSGKEIVVTGWARDDDTSAPIQVLVASGRTWLVVPADRSGNRFEARVPAVPGSNRVCVAGLNVFAGQHTDLGCRTVVK